ncbi:tetraacyldisaccharide 4'-kinase [Methylonatrum kenyense]|uniref:tetraacyldisaccharide 4'-kinase n=1 Tax=Methylonatrum kenyense TaxID=455253 RepID=UPI0020BF2EA4|nr:tetraacyldisaccharide 4'-kinase [Methylonatrum kenyense]MCK8516483.1 tetraacyldisaccharide 4'-kinase [Methylonatrum kenyense]
MTGIPDFWLRRGLAAYLLWPLALLFRAVVGLRRLGFQSGLFRSQRLPVPVIVVGNIFVGGTGKTPLVLWLAETLRARGRRPGIVTRGYGGSASSWPQAVTAQSDPAQVGDEPVLLARRSSCPVMAGPDRVGSGLALIEHHGCDCLISDDGLQHYALQRDLEIVVIDGKRGLGNGFLMPAGPLREPPARLRSVNLLLSNGGPSAWTAHHFSLRLDSARQLVDGGTGRALTDFAGQEVHAVSGIGNPQRFFDALRTSGIKVIPHAFPDHHPFRSADLEFADGHPVLMTEKDAVKCEPFAKAHYWVVPARTELSTSTRQTLEACLEHCLSSR